MGESILHADERCCGLKNLKAEVSAKKQVLRMSSTELGGADWLFPRATIHALPDPRQCSPRSIRVLSG